MITGIQITKAANDDLLNSSGCWTAKGEARCIAAAGFAEDEVAVSSDLVDQNER